MENIKKKPPEIDSFHLTSFLAWTFIQGSSKKKFKKKTKFRAFNRYTSLVLTIQKVVDSRTHSIKVRMMHGVLGWDAFPGLV